MKIELPWKYVPRKYQEPAWRYFQGNEEGKRGVCVWHRRAGKDLFAINLISSQLFQRKGVYWHLLPTYKQGRSIVWNGMTRGGYGKDNKAMAFLDYFPPEIIERKLDQEMRIHFVNGSIYQVVGTDDVDLLVGTNPVGCVFSEYSLQNKEAWTMLSPILRENGGWALFIYTPRGRNHGWELYKMARENPEWFCDTRQAGDLGTRNEKNQPVIPDSEIAKDRAAGIPEEIIQQEYFVSFDAPLVGAFYSQQMTAAANEHRIRSLAVDPRVPVDTYWDIGFDDQTAIVFVQSVAGEHRFIDYYENSGEPLPHYIRKLKTKDYIYGKHYGPWDIEIHEFTSGRSRLETARGLGLRFIVTPQHDLEDGIENTRNILHSCWFDARKCERLIEALKTYRKEWDTKLQVWKKPTRDWSTHAADAMRYFAWHQGRRPRAVPGNADRVAEDDYAYL